MQHPQQGELRLVTAVFADISGFSNLASRLDPEELSDAIDPVIEALGNVVARYGGFVEKYAGDALLAVFGAPVSHEDDPTRALLAALEMRKELQLLQPELALHVGVNSGRGVARSFGSEARADYGVIGEPIVIAQRLEAAAPPGDIYVSEQTRRLVEAMFEFDSVGALTLKGFDEPIETWRLASEETGHATPPEPLVGRVAELAELKSVIADLRAGRGAGVAVVGEPGVGKSRLSQELHADAGDLLWLQLRCFSYESDHAYAPYAELLRRVEHPHNPHFDSLLGDPAAQELGPEAFRRELHRAFRSWLSALLAKQPVVLAVEDIHWMDASSLALTAELAPLRDELPLLVYVTTREEGTHALPVLAEPRLEVRLAPFEPDEVEAIISGLLDGARPPLELIALVVERSAGNPFFAGELVRSLREAGALRFDDGWQMDLGGTDATVPATVEGALSARIDLLTLPTGALLQKAAVIGRRVPVRLLSELTADVEPGVKELVRQRFFVRLNPQTVAFNHALVQEVAYGRILRRHRRDLHAQVAEAVERLYGREGAAIELLARHLYHAEAGLKAVRYLRLAAERARRMYANEEAVTRFRMALERVAAVEEGERPVGLEAAVQRELGEVLDLTGRHPEAAAAYRSAVLAESDVRQRARSMAMLGTVVKRAGRYTEADRLLAEAEAELGPLAAESDDGWWAAWLDVADARFSLYYWLDDPRMEPLIERMRPRIEAAGTPQQRMRFFSSLAMLGLRRERFVPSDATVQAAEAELAAGQEVGDLARHFDIGFCRLWRSELAEAEEHFDAALAFAERTGDAILRTRCLLYFAIACRKRGDVTRVAEILASTDLADGLGYRGLAEANRAWVALRERDLPLAEAHGQAALADWGRNAQSGPTAFQWTARWPLLAAAIARGDVPAARSQAQAMVDPSLQPLPDSLVRALAEENFDRALTLARKLGYT
jgi:adenylate cyclase